MFVHHSFNMKKCIGAILFCISLTTQAQQMEAAGLTYLVQQPRVQSVKPPLLILLHGYGSNEHDLLSMANRLPGQFTIVAARAPITLTAGSYAWYRLNMSGGKTQYNGTEAEQARQQLLRFIETVRQTYNASSVVLMGFSQGAIMSYSLALTQPQKIKGIIALSGRILTDVDAHLASSNELQKLKIFIGHGTSDQVLPVANGEAAYVKCKQLQTQVTFKEYAMGHEISFPELRDIQQWIESVLLK
jgi:phospholipase/carboxylesterase